MFASVEKRKMTNAKKQAVEKKLSPFLCFEHNERSARSLRKGNIHKRLKADNPGMDKQSLEDLVVAELEATVYRPKFGKYYLLFMFCNCL